MAFYKTATIKLASIASGSYADGSFKFTKRASQSTASIYRDGGSKISVQAMLDLAASEYDISSNPNDYIFEAARAVTAEVPNQNGDAFPRAELLRFDHRLGKAIFETFIGKPHHINHRADNPKTARGIVLDASYNDLAEPLPTCPACGNKTASVENRDSTGLNCRKCGTTVKDEFVELLIAVDTKKDPTFARGVKNGSLNSLSMGCSAGYTDCSICENRARTVAQFCKHIKSGNKKKIFKTASGPKQSFEKCGEVVFDEISRVDQPADPTALQKEIFSISKQSRPNLLLMAERMSSHTAQLMGGGIDQNKLLEELEEIADTHPELYRKLHDLLGAQEDEVGEDVPEPKSIDDYEKKRTQDMDAKKITPAEMGIKPDVGGLPATIANKIASDINSELVNLLNKVNNEEPKVSLSNLKFAESYKDIEVEVTERGNIRAFTPRGTLFIVRTSEKPGDADSARTAATNVLTHIAEHGLVKAATDLGATLNPHIAQVLEYHLEDFADGREDGDKGPITDDAENDMAEALATPAKDLQKDFEPDHQEKLSTPPTSVTKDHDPDHKEKVQSPAKSVTDKEINDMDSARAKPAKDTLKDVIVDRSDKLPKSAQAAPPPPAGGDMPVAAEEKCAECGKAGCGGKCAGEKDAARPTKIPTEIGDRMPSHMTDATGKDKALPMSVQDGSPLPGINEESGDMTMDSLDLSPEVMMKLKQILNSEDLDLIASKTAATKKKYVSRMARIYKSRFDKVKAEAESKVAAATNSAISTLESRFIRALRLAAKRQAMNLEASPLKARMFDVLASKMDLDSESIYPGMDEFTASRIIEATTAGAFDEFVDVLVKRAAEFTAMSADAFRAIESDIKNLRPVAVEVPVAPVRTAGREDVRTAAINGNLVVAPAPTSEVVSSGDKQANIRSALGSTKVQRTSQAWKK